MLTGTTKKAAWPVTLALVPLSLLALGVGAGEGRSQGPAANTAQAGARAPSPSAARRASTPRVHPGRELGELRTPRTRTYADESGIHTEAVRPSAGLYRDPEGTVQRTDNALVPAADGTAAHTNRAGRYSVRVEDDASAPFRVSVGDAWVELTLLGAKGAGRVRGATGSFPDALPGADLELAAGEDAVGARLAMTSVLAPTGFPFALQTAPGLTPTKAAAGGIDLRDEAGRLRLSLSAPVSYDAGSAFSRRPSLLLGPSTDEGTNVTVRADPALLTAPGRKGPVFVELLVGTGADSSHDPATEVPAFGSSGWETEIVKPPGAYDPFFLSETDVERMAANGLEYLRMPMRPGQFGRDGWVAHYNEVILRAARQGVRVLPWLEGGLDGSGTSNPPRTPASLAAFEEAAKQAALEWGPVNRETGAGRFWRRLQCPGPRCPVQYLPIRAWQVWNEPNNPFYWPRYRDAQRPEGARRDPEREQRELERTVEEYRAAHLSARRGLRASDPEARIVMAGLGASSTLPDFLRRFVGGPGGDCAFDAAALHYYDSSGSPAEMIETVRKVRGALDAGGNREADLWITEFGAASHWPDHPAHQAVRSEQTQRDWVRGVVDGLAPFRDRWQLGPMMHFAWKDNGFGLQPGERHRDYFPNAGLLTSGGAVAGRAKSIFTDYSRAGLDTGARPLPPVRSCG